MKFKKLIFFVLFNLCIGKLYSQNISYDLLNSTSEYLKEYLSNTDKYFSGGTSDLPYFQGKINNSYIKFYKSTSITVIFDLKSQTEFLKLVQTIQKNGNFRFKYCTDYNEPIVYNYQTNSGNKIRFNFDEMRISVEYPSKTNSFLESNSEFTPVFVCISEDAYAYHTNFRCEGLGNCDSKIAKTNIKEAKKYNYSICERCTTDYNKSSSANSYTSTSTKTSTINKFSYDDYKRELKNKKSNSKQVTQEQIAEAELMFENYLPKLLKSKGEYATIYSQYTSAGDFNNDGFDDIVIKFTYGFGGTAIGGMEAAFYEVKNDKINVVAGYAPNHRFSIDKIINGTVYATKILYDEDDSQCCPSIRIPIKLKYSDNIILVSE